MQEIKLNKQIWELDITSPLGDAGGFGEVFRGKGKDCEVAIKRLKMTATEAAHRELEIGKSLAERQFNNIVPILDYGQDSDSDRYFLVMPICDKSLQDEIKNRSKLPVTEIIEILLSILYGLKEVLDITHRDIKPPNILMHESVWKIADFGIAKFVEDSTSLETLRDSLTPLYAAPEQWRLERPTGATDIYAVGCIAHTLITGNPPFLGDVNKLRQDHLFTTPPLLNELPASARSIISKMLQKSPAIRPKLERCIEVFQKVLENHEADNKSVVVKMTEAISEVTIIQGKREVERLEREESKRQFDLIYKEAVKDINLIKNRLFREIKKYAKEVIDERSSSDTRIVIENAILTFDVTIDSNNIKGLKKNNQDIISGGKSGWGMLEQQSSWNIIAFTGISIEQRGRNHEGYYKRSANLVYGRPNENSEYRWYEMAFWSLSSSERRTPPFALDYVHELDQALSKVGSVNNLAYQPLPIDGEDEDSFIDYWMGLMTQAMLGTLTSPSRLPMNR